MKILTTVILIAFVIVLWFIGNLFTKKGDYKITVFHLIAYAVLIFTFIMVLFTPWF